MKMCSRCNVEKPLNDFAKSACKKDGRTYSCKSCIEIGRKERLAADPERAERVRELDAARKRAKADEIYQKIKARKEADTEYAERVRMYAKKYAEKNREKELKRGQAYRLSITETEKARETRNAYMREWRASHSERINQLNREKRRNDTEKITLDNARRRERHDPIAGRDAMLKRTYGITLDEYKRRYSEQGGKCGICGDVRPDCGRDGLVVDHCHAEGNVRKLLCTHCNKGLGHFRDNVQRMVKAIEYLKLFQKD